MLYNVYVVDDAKRPDPKLALWNDLLSTLPVCGAVFTLPSGTFEVTGHAVVPSEQGDATRHTVCLRVRALGGGKERGAKGRGAGKRGARERGGAAPARAWCEPTLALEAASGSVRARHEALEPVDGVVA